MLCLGTAYVLLTLALTAFVPSFAYWRGWADQKQYLASARAFAALRLAPELHWYPLLYPLAGAPFAWLPVPFAPVGLACFLAAFAGFRRFAEAFGETKAMAALLFFLGTLADPWIGKLWIEPWSSTLSAALGWVALGMAARSLLTPGWLSGRRAVLLGLTLALIPLARPNDVVAALFIAPLALWRPLLRERRWRLLLPFSSAAVAAIAAYGLLHLAIYGPRPSDYMLLSREYGFNFGQLGWKAVTLLLAPAPWFPGGTAMLRRLPWLILGAAGLVSGILLLRGPQRALAACLSAIVVAQSILLIAYVDLLPTGLWRFNSIHYFKWMLPGFVLFGWLVLVRWHRQWRKTGLVLALLITLTGFRYDARPVAAGEPARALVFTAPAGRWIDIYQAHSIIVDAGGPLRNFFDYHQIPDPHGKVWAVALHRDFVADPHWIGQAQPGAATWPLGEPSHDGRLAGPWPRVPAARLAPRLSYGFPCWIPLSSCGSERLPASP